MAIKQFSGEWVPVEDRILLRINTTAGEEYRFWFTRHILDGFLNGSQTLAVQALMQHHSQEVAQAIQEFQQQSVAQQLDHTTAYEPQEQKPLGEVPALITALRITIASQQTVVVDLETHLGKTVHLNLNEFLLTTMVSLLNKLQEQARWQIKSFISGQASGYAISMSATLKH